VTLVSVVIPYYRRADWLREAVASVLAQTLDDLELIVVDDGSDEPPGFLEEIADPRVRYVQQRHRGASAARNHGIGLSTGTYIAFLDADDLFMPDKLRIQVGQMEAHPQIPMSHTSYERMDPGGGHLEDVASGVNSGSLYPAIVHSCRIATPTVMLRRDALERDHLRFNESVSVGEDVILWVEIARNHPILGIDQVLTRVRMHGRNAFSDPKAQYRGGIAIYRSAFRSDRTFRFADRRRLLAGVALTTTYFHLERGERLAALPYAIRAAAYWPFERANVRPLVVLVVPRPIRQLLKRIRHPLRRAS